MKSNVSLIAMNIGELGRLLHHAENNHSPAHYTGGRMAQRCRPFLNQYHEIIAIEFDTGNTTHQFVSDPEADELSVSMFDHVMAWLDQSNDDVLDS